MVSILLAALLVSPPTTVRAMSFNIWVGGTEWQPLERTVEAIQASGADVVGIQEPGPSLPRLAESLGWNYSAQAAILTRYPILEDWKVEGNRGGGAKLLLDDGSEILFYNDHFFPNLYGPYEIRDGRVKTAAQAQEGEANSGRIGQMARALRHLEQRPDQDLPVIFTGDFNSPSHLDWVEATASRNFGLVVPWPVTQMAEEAGFQDGFRAVYPDPVAKPGTTWTPGVPPGVVKPHHVMDRIDFVLFRGALRPTLAWTVGESGPVSDIASDPWPSDHRAVAVEFTLSR